MICDLGSWQVDRGGGGGGPSFSVPESRCLYLPYLDPAKFSALKSQFQPHTGVLYDPSPGSRPNPVRSLRADLPGPGHCSPLPGVLIHALPCPRPDRSRHRPDRRHLVQLLRSLTMLFLPAFAGFIIGIVFTAVAFGAYIDLKLKPKLWDAQYRLENLERKWDCPYDLSARIAEVSIKERQAQENARQAAIITVAVRDALKNT